MPLAFTRPLLDRLRAINRVNQAGNAVVGDDYRNGLREILNTPDDNAFRAAIIRNQAAMEVVLPQVPVPIDDDNFLIADEITNLRRSFAIHDFSFSLNDFTANELMEAQRNAGALKTLLDGKRITNLNIDQNAAIPLDVAEAIEFAQRRLNIIKATIPAILSVFQRIDERHDQSLLNTLKAHIDSQALRLSKLEADLTELKNHNNADPTIAELEQNILDVKFRNKTDLTLYQNAKRRLDTYEVEKNSVQVANNKVKQVTETVNLARTPGTAPNTNKAQEAIRTLTTKLDDLNDINLYEPNAPMTLVRNRLMEIARIEERAELLPVRNTHPNQAFQLPHNAAEAIDDNFNAWMNTKKNTYKDQLTLKEAAL